MDSQSSSSLHIAMYPWLAFGHITPFLHLANKLARNGDKVSFLIPEKTQSKIQNLNRVSDLVEFIPVRIPHVEGLPLGAETTADVAPHQTPLVATAMDKTEPDVEILLQGLKPDVVFFDFACWLPRLAKSLGFKTVYFSVVSPVFVAYMTGRTPGAPPEQWLLEPPSGFPDMSVKLRRHELPYFLRTGSEAFGSNIKLPDRLRISMTESDAFASKGMTEIEGPFVELIQRRLRTNIWLTGPVFHETTTEREGLDAKWVEFLRQFERGSVVFCCLGSEQKMSVGQFRDLVLGLELCGRPFLAAVTLPEGASSMEEALPEGFAERVKERGVLYGGWIQQQQILAHPSVGCFLTHCGACSITEALVNPCQIVMIPYQTDNFFLARMIGNSLKAGIEVERDEENGWFSGESVRKAIETVMCEAESNEIGREIQMNRAKLHQMLRSEGLESRYIDDLCDKLKRLCFDKFPRTSMEKE